MAHFAEIRSDNNQVLRVLVMDNQKIADNGGEYTTESEQWVYNNHGPDLLIQESLGGTYPETYWKQTSYNTKNNTYFNSDGTVAQDQTKAKRGNYAGIGYIYDSTNDIFYPPKPYNSWTLDLNTADWTSPVPYPDDGQNYEWNEDNLNWELIQ